MGNPKTDYLLERILNESRGFLIDDTTDYVNELNIAGFIVIENAVLANLEVDETDVIADMKLTGITLTTIYPPIMAGTNKWFNRLKLTSGIVWAITTNSEGSVT